jgi:Glycosyl transferase family 2
MRIGINPLRNTPAPAQLRNVVISCITHLPNQLGYHAKRFEVIKTSLHSLKYNAHIGASIVIWDNGSISALHKWIEKFIKPDIFIKSQNIGKHVAQKMIFSMLPADTIVSYSDDDMYHEPHWIQPQIDILKHFPNVACVSGYVVRANFRYGCNNAMKWAAHNATIKSGRFIPEQYERDFCASIERDYSMHEKGMLSDLDYIISYKGMEAYATAHHCQVLGRAGTLSQCVVLNGQSLANEMPFDIALDQAGLRLGTLSRLTRHMGNEIDDELRKQIKVAK